MATVEELLFESIYELIVQTSTNLPADVRLAIQKAHQAENALTSAGLALSTIAKNIYMAESQVLPICQDTGMPTFKVKTPIGFNQIELKKIIQKAIAKATHNGKLRTNSVNSLTGENTGDNLGPGTPVIYFEQWEESELEIKLLLKGGGCENKNIQYSLPSDLEGIGKAGRDLDGVRKCILHAVYQAQGQGCSAGFLGVSIGGDHSSGYAHAKEQLFRNLFDENPVKELEELENYIMQNANKLGIGTMGFGGDISLLGCKIGVQNRLPASFFVSVSYNCWAYRRLGIIVNPENGQINKWLYRELPKDLPNTESKIIPTFEKTIIQSSGKEIKLNTPFNPESIKQLKVGDIVLISGIIYTGRDSIHKHLSESDQCPVDLNNMLIYHCGPVVIKENELWQIKAAGPTTSIREEPYQAGLIEKFGIKAIMGKGGMGAKTLKALKENGAVYLNAIGGAAQFYSDCIKEVKGVDFLNFGVPEAMWHLRVENFPAIVTMDSHGNSLHSDIEKTSLEKLSNFQEKVYK
jgi:fumarate hydratase, class I